MIFIQFLYLFNFFFYGIISKLYWNFWLSSRFKIRPNGYLYNFYIYSIFFFLRNYFEIILKFSTISHCHWYSYPHHYVHINKSVSSSSITPPRCTITSTASFFLPRRLLDRNLTSFTIFSDERFCNYFFPLNLSSTGVVSPPRRDRAAHRTSC